MNKTTSIYLDLLRFTSAILVFVFHASYARYDGEWLNSVSAFGHDAVMIFFVLSGFVIAFITKTKETELFHYIKSRLGRLYSVVIPALILTVALDLIGKNIDPSMYVGGHFQASEPIYRLFANLLFINEIWFDSWRAFSNGPFWSLSYEFWYYVIFASWFYFSGNKKLLLTSLAMLIAGPKILILFPVWLMGVLTFHLSSKVNLNKFMAFLCVVLPIFIYALMREYGIQKLLLAQTVEFLGRDFVYTDLKWSRRFISDYIVGGLVSIHILGMISLSKTFSFSKVAEKVIRYFAGMTFAFYLLHYPLLQFFGSIVDEGVVIVALTSITIVLLAPLTEGKKREWVVLIDKVLLYLTNLSKNTFRSIRS